MNICQNLPALYLQDGSIIPLCSAIQHFGEGKLIDDAVLLVALDEHVNFFVVNAVELLNAITL